MTTAEKLSILEKQLARLRTPGGYFNAGIPNYEHLFGRDACVAALQTLHREPSTALATLEVLAKYQGRRTLTWREEYPGKILHESYPGGWSEKLADLLKGGDRFRLLLGLIFWRFPYYGSVDAGAWYLILLHHYHKSTGDREVVKRFWPAAEGITQWLGRYGVDEATGLVVFRSHYIFGLRNQSWKDTISTQIEPPVAMIEVQGYYYYALSLLADLAQDVMGNEGQARTLRKRAANLKAAFHLHFTMVDGTYPIAVGGTGIPVETPSSNPGQLLFTGILGTDDAGLVVDRLMRPDMCTPFGIRTESTSGLNYNSASYQNGSVWPFDNWVLQQGFAKAGFAEEAGKLKSGMEAVFDHWNKIPELYEVTSSNELREQQYACHIQAWSIGALINLLEDAPLL